MAWSLPGEMVNGNSTPLPDPAGEPSASVEARWRLESVREVCRYEAESLRLLEEPLLDSVIASMAALQEEIEAVLVRIRSCRLRSS